MKKAIFAALAAAILFAGCQKTPDNIPENTPENVLVQSEKSQEAAAVEAPAADESDQKAESDVAENAPVQKKEIVSHNNTIFFDQVGIKEEMLTPEFPTTRGTKNGDFRLLKPGTFRYFLVSKKDDVITEKQYADYRTKIFDYIKSISDNGEVRAFNNSTEEIGDKLDKMPELPMNEMLQILYYYQGNKVALYVNYKKYQPASFAGIKDPMNAIYVGVSVME